MGCDRDWGFCDDQSVTGKSLKFVDFQIVVQLILVLVCTENQLHNNNKID